MKYNPSGNDYAGVNLNLRFKWRMDERHAIRVCFDVETSGERKQKPSSTNGTTRKMRRRLAPARRRDSRRYGTTFPEDPSTQKKYVVKAVEAAVENCLLLKDEASACDDVSYRTDMSIPQASDFPDFTKPRIKRTCLLSRYESYGQGGVSHLGGSSSA